jgi:CheY-like chemotaxis protein/Tfp pilus assembly protein PilZ
MKNILIVDHDEVMLQVFVALLKSQGGFLNVLSAKSGKAALEIISQRRIHIVITELYMSEIDGFELVTLVAKQYPDIRVIVMTNNASPMLRAKIKQIPTAVHFDQTKDISLLTKRIFTELHIDYGGQVRGLSLPSFLQMIELEEHNCTLQISAKGDIGRMSIVNGELVAAKVGPWSGESAALLILAWENVLIDIDYSFKEVRREITKPLMTLLHESRRLVDERKSRRPSFRKHARFECLVAVDYDISDWTYQCFLRDISMGGAYIETEQSIKVGQKIILTFSSPKLNRRCAINGQVVRRDKKAIGVRFDEISLRQKKVIQVLTKGSFKLPPELNSDLLGRE